MDESLNQATTDPGLIVFEPRRSLAAARSWARACAASLACAALLAFMALQMLSVVWQKSITVDEIVMIPAAYYHLAAANCQLVHEHPPLVKILAGVPLLFLQPDETDPAKLGRAPDSPVGKWTYCERFWDGNPALFESISFWARLPMIALSVLTGVLLFAFARELFGGAAASLGYLLVVYALLRYVRAPSARRALLLGAAGGVACLTKFSMLMVAPVIGVVFLWLCWKAPRSGASRKAVLTHAGATFLAALF